MFDVADYSGFRLTYLLLIEIAVNVGASLASAIALLFYLTEPKFAFMLFFVVAAGYILIVATSRFSLYKR